MFRLKVEAVVEQEEAFPQPIFPQRVVMMQPELGEGHDEDLDKVDQEGSQEDDHIVFFSGNPAIEIIKGHIHLFREETDEASKMKSDIIVMLAVPQRMSSSELCSFLARAKGVTTARVLREANPSCYMVVFQMKNQLAADNFYRAYNGIPFNSMEPERCKLVYVSGVEFVEPSDGSLFPSTPSQCELPTCPVCLERLEGGISGVLVTVCNHSFHCKCLSQWHSDSSCPVCRYTSWDSQRSSNDTCCDVCEASSDLWICLICGHVGCSRYQRGHAVSHYKETGHTYSLELETQRVWDYAGEGYVHRLLQAGDGKVVELPAPMQSTDFRAPPAKLEKIVTEYNFLLTSQLEAQRAYYEGVLEKRSKKKAGQKEVSQLKAKMLDVMRENQFLSEMNKTLEQRDRGFSKQVNQIKQDYEARILELEHQVRDMMFALEAQRLHQDGSKLLQDGDVVSVGSPVKPVYTPKKKPTAKKKKKRK